MDLSKDCQAAELWLLAAAHGSNSLTSPSSDVCAELMFAPVHVRYKAHSCPCIQPEIHLADIWSSSLPSVRDEASVLTAHCHMQMSALGETLSPEIATEVDKLQTACRNRQTALSRSFEELSEKLSRASAVAQFVVAHRRKELPAGKGRRNIYGRQDRTHNPMIAG